MACFRRHPDAAVYLSQPRVADVLGARELDEFGDDSYRYVSAKAGKNYAATSPVTRQSGKKRTVLARFIRNDRLADALHQQAQSALRASSGARAYYNEQRSKGLDYEAALRALSNRPVGILHGCLKTGTVYDEATAWSHRAKIRSCLTIKVQGCPCAPWRREERVGQAPPRRTRGAQTRRRRIPPRSSTTQGEELDPASLTWRLPRLRPLR
jgi:hypothetical protein